jgi:hypothetical protein
MDIVSAYSRNPDIYLEQLSQLRRLLINAETVSEKSLLWSVEKKYSV